MRAIESCRARSAAAMAESARARSAAAIESWFTVGTTSPGDSFVIGMRFDELVARRVVFVLLALRVESVCCALTVDTPPKVRAMARPIAQLLENPIRIFSFHSDALRVQAPAGDHAGRAPNGTWDFQHPTQGGATHLRCAPSDDHRRGSPWRAFDMPPRGAKEEEKCTTKVQWHRDLGGLWAVHCG